LIIATGFVILMNVSLFQIALVTQIINAIGLPLVFYFLIKLTSSHDLMGRFVNNSFQKYFATISSVVIVIASVFTIFAAVFWS
jgi:Mn2+/Fe2+ NRAMP family transporter